MNSSITIRKPNIKGMLKKGLVLTLAIAMLVCTGFTGNVEATDKWEVKASMKQGHSDFNTEVIDGKIYAIGGYQRSTPLETMEMYDPITDTFTAKAPMQMKRGRFATAVVNGKIYAIGGIGGVDTAVIEEYDPVIDTWTTKARMKNARVQATVEVYEGKIYIIGGYVGVGNYMTSVEVYDPITNTCEEKASFIQVRTRTRTELINGKIYLIGGIDRYNNAVPYIEEYNIEKDLWTTKNPMPFGYSYFETEVINGQILAIGVLKDSSYTPSVVEYNPSLDIWFQKAPMNNSRSLFTTEKINGKVYMVGGEKSGLKSNLVEEYDMLTDTWTQKASMTYARSSHQTEIVNGKIYAIGGSDSSGDVRPIEVYTPSESTTTPTLTVTPSLETVKVGQEFTTTIAIHNANTICAEDIRIKYDTERFEYIGSEAPEGMKIYKEEHTEDGKLRIITSILGKDNVANGDKDLFILKFKAKSLGEGKVDITHGRIADNDAVEVDVSEENCGEAIINVVASVDVNRSGDTTLIDLGIDGWYYGMNTADTDTTKHDADVDNNGIIDDSDLTAITEDMLINDGYAPNKYV